MLYVVVAHDGDDDGAQARRAAARPAHIENGTRRSEAGGLPLGGAIIGPDGNMVGSVLVIEAADEDEARAIVEGDPYTAAGVWVEYRIYPFKRAF